MSRFRFVILGDTHEYFDELRAVAARINRLGPELVITTGDQISRQADDVPSLSEKWDRFDAAVTAFDMPVVLTAGNHDIFSLASRQVYWERYGPSRLSFDHRDAHFVILDSVELDERGRWIETISAGQLDWLRRDLSSQPAGRLCFVVLHRPMWQNQQLAGTPRVFWLERVQPLLAAHGVAAVFAGDIHRYARYPSLDGVSYYLSGCGAAPGKGAEADGAFRHFCLVSVEDGAWKLDVVREEGTLPDDIVWVPEDG